MIFCMQTLVLEFHIKILALHYISNYEYYVFYTATKEHEERISKIKLARVWIIISNKFS